MPSSSDRSGSVEVERDGRVVTITNVDKVLWPQVAFTKGDMLRYYDHVAALMVPHLAGRPLTLKRFPDGVNGWHWFQTECPHPPPWLPTHEVPSATHEGKVFHQCGVHNTASLLWVANLGTIEMHPLNYRAGRREPSWVVFDLDPGPPADIVDCCDIAMLLHEVLDDLGMTSAVKTSGSLGLHVFVPLAQGHTFDDTRSFARRVAGKVAARLPERVVDTSPRDGRRGKVFIDWRQNHVTKSTVAPYSLRALPIPTVSTPLAWEEVRRATDERSGEGLIFTPGTVVRRVEERGDLFRSTLDPVVQLP